MIVFKFYLYVLAASSFIWISSYFLPRIVDITQKWTGWTLPEGVWVAPLLFLPAIFILNIFYGLAFKVALEIGYTQLFAGLVMIAGNALVFAIMQLVVHGRILLSDAIFLGFIVAGLGAKYWLQK